jgi:hypothetical protein
MALAKATTEVIVSNVVNSLNLDNSALVRAVFKSTIISRYLLPKNRLL